MGRQQLTLLDRATGRRVTVEVDPTWTIDEMKRDMERRGTIGPGETIAFYKPGNNGELVPINSNTVQDLLTLQNMGVTPIMDRGMYQGVWETCRQKLREFANSKGLHFSDYGDMVAASGSFGLLTMSREPSISLLLNAQIYLVNLLRFILCLILNT